MVRLLAGSGRVMDLISFLILLIVAGVCGGLGQAIAGFSRAGCLGSIALGFIGALVGMWLARALRLPEFLAIRISDQVTFPIIWSIVGSALFVAVLGLLTRRSPRA
jgi:uncharacterized membrane protein YeaQ/YmgE (transglycosylase-associated protein family)